MAKRIERIDIHDNNLFEGIKKGASEAEKEVEALAKVLDLLSKELDEINKKGKSITLGGNVTDVESLKKANEQNDIAQRLAKKRAEVDKHSLLTKQQMQSAEESLQRQREKAINQLEKEKKRTEEAERPYNKLSATLNKLRKDYKDLAVAGLDNTSKAKEMRAEIERLDTTLKKVDASTGQFQRNVGNYSSAFSKLSGALGVFGVGLGFDAIVSGVTNFSKEINEMNIQASRLGVSAENMKGFVSQAQSLGTTFGTDINDNMVSANALMKEFNITQEQAFKLMEEGYLSGANSQGDMLDSIKEYSSQIKASGGDANTLFNILNRSGKEGIFSDKGIDVVKEFGLRVREQTSATSDAMNNAFGEQFTDRIFKGINDGSMTSVEALEEVAKKMNDTSIPTNKLQTVIADLFGGPGEDAGLRFIQTLTDISSETGNLVNKTDPYVKQQMEMKRLNEELAVAQQDLFEKLGGTGANMESLTLKAKVLFFQNILPAIGILAKLAIGFATFKTATALANTDFKALLSNFTKLKTDATEAGGKLSGFGNALKGIGWSVAIGFAIELGTKIYDIASGAEYAAEKMARFNKAIGDGQKFGQKLTGDLAKQATEEKRLLDLRLSRGDITKKQYDAELKLSQEAQKARLKFEIQTENENKEREKKRMAMLQSLYDKAINTNPLLRSDLMTKVINKYDASNASLQKSNATLKELYALNNSLKEQAMADEIAKNTSATNTNTVVTKANTKAKKENKKEMKDASDQINELIESMRNLDQFLSDSKIEENTKQFEQALQTQFDEIAKNGEYSIDLLTDLIEKERQYRLAVIERTFEQEKAEAKNSVDLELAELKRNKAIQDLDEEMVNKRKETNKKLEKAQEDYAQKQSEIDKKAKDEADEKRKKEEDAEKESLDKRRKAREEFVNGVIDEMKRLSEEEESKIDSRIEAEKKLQSELIDQANAGNISAQQSIEASKKAEQQATLDKMKEQKKQQALDDIKTLYNVINQNIEKGDNVAVATTKAVGSMALIKSIAKLFQGFASGTEWRLGDENKALFGGVDGHIIRADSSEGIVRGDLMDKAERHGITSIDEMVNRAILFQKVPSDFYKMNDNRLAFVPVTQSNNIDILPLIKEVKELRKEIKNSQSQFSIDPYVINGIARGVTSTERKGNDIRKTLFKA